MNALEQEARPILEPLVRGDAASLDAAQQAVLARWLCLKCIVSEHSLSSEKFVTTRADRERFATDGVIPEYHHIYASTHSMKHALSFARHSQAIAFSGAGANPPLLDAPNNIHTITMRFGRLFVHNIAARISDFTLESRVVFPKFYSRRRLWPFQHETLDWPGNLIMDSQGAAMLQDSLKVFFASVKTTWADLSR